MNGGGNGRGEEGGDEREGRELEFDTSPLEGEEEEEERGKKKKEKKSKLACPRSWGSVMRIGRTWRKLFRRWIGSRRKKKKKNTRAGSSFFRFCYQTRLSQGLASDGISYDLTKVLGTAAGGRRYHGILDLGQEADVI